MIDPISPHQAKQHEGALIPDFVIQAFNEMILENYTKGHASFTQDAVLEKIRNKQRTVHNPAPMSFDNRWLNIESRFRAKGWKVVYDSPAYNEDYAANYKFSDN